MTQVLWYEEVYAAVTKRARDKVDLYLLVDADDFKTLFQLVFIEIIWP